MIAEIALNIPFSDPYDYLIPAGLEEKLQPGMRVIVPLQRSESVGVVVKIKKTSELAAGKLRNIKELLSGDRIFSDYMLQFTKWISDYYLVSHGIVLNAAIPAGFNAKVIEILEVNTNIPELKKWVNLKKTASLENKLLPHASLFQSGELVWKKSFETRSSGDTEEMGIIKGPQFSSFPVKEGTKADQIIQLLKNQENLLKKEISSKIPSPYQALKNLEKKQVIGYAPISRFFKPIVEEDFFELNDEQQNSFIQVEKSLNKQQFQAYLLHGVTGSGKTEVYIHLVREVIKNQQSALVLVPEIALTPQTVSRFRNRFGDQVRVLHSGMSASERFRQWWKIKNDAFSIVIGARSALFAPINKPGLIIVDEEHDPSYKQNENPFYHARDAAVKMASDHRIPIVLGSATPSIESLQNAKTDKYQLLRLLKRAGNQPEPEINIINLKETQRFPGVFYLSKPLYEELRENYYQKKQSILFLNRRGYSAYLSCQDCNVPVLCKNCSIPLTWHKSKNELRCHYCGFTRNQVSRCYHCSSTRPFKEEGIGTQRVEQDLKNLFRDARVLRLDRDQVKTQVQLEEKINLIRNHEVDFIVGTQLISKGHDFPDIGLVCILLAEMSLNIPDFRASERSFQLISQVSGRAGRGNFPSSQSWIQTYNPQHPVLKFTISQDFEGFFKHELSKREFLGDPPVKHQISIQASSESEAHVFEEIQRIYQQLKVLSEKDIEIIGPIEAGIYKKYNRYFWNLYFKAEKEKAAWLRNALRSFFFGKAGWKAKKKVRINLIVDPYTS